MDSLDRIADARRGTGCFAAVDFARGRLFETSDVDEARDICGRVFNPHRLNLIGRGQSLWSRMDHLPLGPMSLNRLTWGAHVHLDPDRLDTYYLVSVPVQGSARFHVGTLGIDVSPRRACVISAPQRFRFEADAQFDQIVLRLEKSAVEAAWTALTGGPPDRPIELEAPLPLDGPAWRAMEPAMRLLAACAAGAYEPHVEPHVQQRVHDMLLTVMLLHLAPTLTPPPSGPARASAALVARAQSYLFERLEAPLTLGEVARATGVAARTLQAAFQAECGMGPMQWLREQRLAAVHPRADRIARPGDTCHRHRARVWLLAPRPVRPRLPCAIRGSAEPDAGPATLNTSGTWTRFSAHALTITVPDDSFGPLWSAFHDGHKRPSMRLV